MRIVVVFIREEETSTDSNKQCSTSWNMLGDR